MGKVLILFKRKIKGIYVPTGRRLIVRESSKIDFENKKSEVNTGVGTSSAKGNRVMPDANDSEDPEKADGNVYKNVKENNNDEVDVAFLVPNDVVILIPSDEVLLVPNPKDTTKGTSLEDTSESVFIEATQMVEFVPETQLDERFKNQVAEFLNESWNNMAEMDDPGGGFVLAEGLYTCH